MKYLAAYCLAALGGKTDVSDKDLKKILESVGANVDDDKVKTVIAALKGKSLHEVIASGMTKVGGLSFGGGGSGAQTTSAPTETKQETKEVVKEEEPEEEANQDMGGLFGDDDDY